MTVKRIQSLFRILATKIALFEPVHGRPQTFFQGARTYFLPKKQQKDTIFPQKV